MVGVAGKSRACHDCKRRRVKCDFRRPVCARCEKASIKCKGYERTPIFVNRTWSEPFTTASLAISEARLGSEKAALKPLTSLQESFKLLKTEASNVFHCPVVYRSQAWALLERLYLPQTKSTNGASRSSTTSYSWLPAVCQLTVVNKALDQALLAFCAIQIHLVEPTIVSLDAALQLYSESLPELVQILETTQERIKIETLAAIVVITTCELFVQSNDHAWHAHTQGIAELLRRNLSFDVSSAVWVNLCSRLRTICVILGLARYKRTSLDPILWQQYLPANSTAESFDRLLDIVSQAPLLLERSVEVFRQDVPDQELVQSLHEVFFQIVEWQRAYKCASTSQTYWTVPSELHNVADDGFENKLFPFCLEFKDLNAAIQMVFSTAVLLQLLSVSLRLRKASNDLIQANTEAFDQSELGRQTEIYPIETPDLLSILSTQHEAKRLARILCQSVEYCFRYEMGTLGPQSFCYPRMVMRDYFARMGQKRELDWCTNVWNSKGPNFRSGIEMMLFVSQDDLLNVTHNG